MHLTADIIDYVLCSNTSNLIVTYGLSWIICREVFWWVNALVYMKNVTITKPVSIFWIGPFYYFHNTFF